MIRSSIHLSVGLSTSGFTEDMCHPLNCQILHETESEAWEQQAHTLRVRGLSMARQHVRYSASRLTTTGNLVAVVSVSNGYTVMQSRYVGKMYGFVGEKKLRL